MKKILVISSLIATSLINTYHAKAEASKEENIGVASGALTGFALGGPVGFILGAAAGGLIGQEVEKANRLDEVEIALNQSNLELLEISQTLETVKQKSQREIGNLTHSLQNEILQIAQDLSLNLMFTTNSAQLSKQDQTSIEQVAKLLNHFPELKIKLDGYADPRGSKTDNLELSQSRVESVSQALAILGIDESRIELEAHGELAHDELFDPDTHQSLEQNNRDAFALARKVRINFFQPSTTHVAQN